MSSIASGGSIASAPASLKIRTAGKEVVANGTVITADNSNLEFQLAHLRIVMEFVTDGSSARIEGRSDERSTLTLRLFNFNNSIGAGTISPLEIGTLNGKKLLLAFMVYALSETSSKTVHYTFMLGDAI
ncbi:hypothetical protein PQQ75_08290 [Paraburkholderia aspalathi]|uniref:DUF6864 domain-containing function n=1 Tax=Paraburkholderia aspalathi TaxID=1324617 RepID=UPI0038B7C2FC